MKRRTFIQNTSLATIGIMATTPILNAMEKYRDVVIGHGTHKYKVDLNWGALNSSYYPVNDCHEMVQDSKGRILLLTNHTKNNVIVYDKSGKLIEVWGTDYPGAHGLTLKNENGTDMLYISDNSRHEVIKTTIDGKVVKIFPYPKESGKYASKDLYIPTETAVADNGDVYVADGYGEQYIMHYNAQGELLNVFGGKGSEDHLFNNAHGICIDTRNNQAPTLLITARQQNKLKRFSMDGDFIESYNLPGAFICRPVISGNHIYLATIWSGDGGEGTGFVSILDENNQLISAPGGAAPTYENGILNKMHQELKIFHHPHDVCVDDEENLYVAQWNSGKTYPIKLNRV
ncbi:peptidylglycine monooxygenase [Arenibacter certesii]|uniref:Peptidylglycine monooxygenase n=1 Tax=Arenibacter certesii TaxID=228955 RepID=A0A918ITM5_9FLAO|nr:peptidylglycine monooxygenase [Arenibacter certesii]GGW27584.1 peptidylglycine monooxygenase [Arenibacter certesii]